ncbi:MAG: hypothetical protein O2901_16875, partial [Verrucomicrobia bacterium]|nr:hypothetical protein [Verrucomicrobiota bacterium]
PFDDPEIVAAEPLFYTRRDTDPALTRYFAMLGMNDPLCLFLGNYDRFSLVTGKWTELGIRAVRCGPDAGDALKPGGDGAPPSKSGHNSWRALRRQRREGEGNALGDAPVSPHPNPLPEGEGEECASGSLSLGERVGVRGCRTFLTWIFRRSATGDAAEPDLESSMCVPASRSQESPPAGEFDYLKLTLEKAALPTIGANGFVFRRSLLEIVNWSPYFFDIDVLAEAIDEGHRHVAKVRCGIVHLYCSNLGDFYRKQDRRIRDFLHFSQERERSYPWQQQRRGGILKFCIYTLLVVPLIVQMVRGASRQRDWAWLYHIPVCWITLWVYGVNVVAKALGIRRGPKSRDAWQK